jgi:putative oxidoreductase
MDTALPRTIRPLGRWDSEVYALFRFVAGFLFSFHGAQKLFGLFGGKEATDGLSYAAGVIELVGGLLIAFGLAAGLVAFLASGEMAVAYFKAHFSLEAFWPIENRGELAALYCFVFLFVAARGSGAYSLDAVLRGGKSVRSSEAPRRFELPHAARARHQH